MRSNEKNYLFLFLCVFVDYQEGKKMNKELELVKLEFHTRNSSLVSSSTIDVQKREFATLALVFL